MRLGIIGLPNCGKTTLFNALTGSNHETSPVSSGQFEVHTAVVNVPDERLDVLEKMYTAKKKVFATITFTDIGGLEKGIGEGGIDGQMRTELQQVDGYVHVIRAFKSDVVAHPYGDINPQRDLETLDGEFLLLDLIAVEKRLEKIESELKLKGKRADQNLIDSQPLMEKLKAHLDTGEPLRNLALDARETQLTRGFGFLTLKPVLMVINLGDERKAGDDQLKYSYKQADHIALQAALEAELSQLDADDKVMFMEEYGVTELSAQKVIRLAYELLTIQSFLTAGEKEVRAWTIPAGANAWEAAGAIHSDIQKGFIRAEVMQYKDLIDLGSEKDVKAAGKMRLESKEYIIQEGDIIVFRHSG